MICDKRNEQMFGMMSIMKYWSNGMKCLTQV